MGSMWINVLILMTIMSFALFLGGYNTMFTAMVCTTTEGCTAPSEVAFENMYDGFKDLITLATGLGIVVGLLSYPNVYAIFGIIMTLLLSFFTLPLQMLTDQAMPIEIRLFFSGVFGMAYLLSLLSWYKGVND